MNILFVCTGNVFRSMSAEYILKDYLKKHNIKDVNVSSAGIVATPEDINPMLVDTLKKIGIDVTKHVQRRLTQKIIDDSDIIVAMGLYHREFLKEHFNIAAPYYNLIATGSNTPILDLDQTDEPQSKEHDRRHFETVVRHLCDTMPEFFKNMKKYVRHV